MRKISDFQLNSPRLDGVIEEVVQARGEYSTLNDRLEDLKQLSDYKITSATLVGSSLIITVEPGLAFIDEIPILSHNELSVAISQPEPQMVYYIYLCKDGELAYSSEQSSSTDTLLLGTVEIGEVVEDITITDLRPFLQKGGKSGGLGEEAAERIEALEYIVRSFTFSEKHIAEEGQQVFTLNHPYPAGLGKLRVFVNGILMTEGEEGSGDYVETDNRTVTFNYPLTAGEGVRFLMENTVPHIGFTETFIAEEGQTEFILSHIYPAGQERLRVYVNGLLYEPGLDNDYIEPDNYTVVFNDPFFGGERVKFVMETTSVDDIIATGGYASIGHRLNSQLGDCNVDISIEYDEYDRIDKEIWTGDVNKTVKYTYNEQGRRAGKVVTEGNLVTTVTYTYDGAGRVKGISVRKTLNGA